ncbi:unnamed protein product [Rotaria sp. Silwood2]|nr:unnamed protein product [Rotaria sp. Silwood2]CAF3041678.1 unnamed protein product [Rotaria sp. Silwood2]CAF3390073.1 unnamed protein product [Rotaria sp. Silwood2]CAF4237705.1 unnamed protein product [Rotaria sp. Silwood2]CAF4460582.1 unnamed protein product [Rotaria sp. Silwood2]
MRLVRHVLERLDRIKKKSVLATNLLIMSIDEYIKQHNIENWDKIFYKSIFQSVFVKAIHWHTAIVTEKRAKFVDSVRRKFHDSVLDFTEEFRKRTYPIEQLMFEAYRYSKLQLNSHPTDNKLRERLSIELEDIVGQTSNILAEYFYHQYICKLENILNNICPQLKDLYRTKLTLDKCIHETHTLVLRVCRPVIMATLRYSHLDLLVTQDTINELIYIAPTVAFNIANIPDKNGERGILSKEILKSEELLANRSEISTSLIKTLQIKGVSAAPLHQNMFKGAEVLGVPSLHFPPWFSVKYIFQ